MSPNPTIPQPRPQRLSRRKQNCEIRFGIHAGKPISSWTPFKIRRLFKCLSFFALTTSLPLNLAPAPNAVPPRLSADTLHSLLQQALDAFAQNDFAAAAGYFHRIDSEFPAEPELRDPDFLRRMLPIRGRAELAAGQPTAAIQTLTQFLDTFPADPQFPAALLDLATALKSDNQPDDAAARFFQFERSFPHRPETGLALSQRAEILLALNQPDTAREILADYLASPAPPPIQNQIRLHAARLFLDAEDPSSAARFLLDHQWDIAELPEISRLSFLALDLGDRLLAAADPANALSAYRLVLPRSDLLSLQSNRLYEIEQKLARLPATGDFWRGFYQRLQHDLTRRLASLESAEDYTPALLLRRGQAFLLAKRPREAWLLFEHLALNKNLADPIREDAHYRWIVAASELEIWEEALTIARNFVDRYPQAELAPQALFLIANTHQEQRRYSEAIEVLADLLERFPAHPMAQRWRFTRGFNFTLLEDFESARADLHRAAADYPESPLTPNCQLWHALTHFFERDYPAALAAFDSLADRYPSHPLAGEILYRRAATLYAMREYERAETQTAAFVEKFPRHQRHSEALVLLGDIRMGTGELESARHAFASISPEAKHLFLHGLFQRGKILRAQENYAEMIRLFSDYAQSSPDSEIPKPRLSEALYWIGWAHAQLGKPADAIPVFLSALERHGDDPHAAEIASILAQLERLAPHLDSADADFPLWLQQQKQTALAENRLTYFSRLNLHLARAAGKSNQPFQSEALLFEIANQVPLDRLGPDVLGPVGHLLISKNLSSGRDFLLQILENHPSAPERAYTFHGLGKLATAENLHEEALRWFRRFLHETPTHPLAPEVMQLTGETLLQLDRHSEAAEQFEDILRQRNLRGRPHALALSALARTARESGNAAEAIAYYQRIYTVHRAQPDLVAAAYLTSATLFREIDDPNSARRTLEEMLSLPELENLPEIPQARELLQSLPPPQLARQTAL